MRTNLLILGMVILKARGSAIAGIISGWLDSLKEGCEAVALFGLFGKKKVLVQGAFPTPPTPPSQSPGSTSTAPQVPVPPPVPVSSTQQKEQRTPAFTVSPPSASPSSQDIAAPRFVRQQSLSFGADIPAPLPPSSISQFKQDGIKRGTDDFDMPSSVKESFRLPSPEIGQKDLEEIQHAISGASRLSDKSFDTLPEIEEPLSSKEQVSEKDSSERSQKVSAPAKWMKAAQQKQTVIQRAAAQKARRRETREELPPIQPPIPSVTDAKGMIFISAPQYSSIKNALSSIRSGLRDGEKVMGTLINLKNAQDSSFEAWHLSIESIQRKLFSIDRVLFEPEE